MYSFLDKQIETQHLTECSSAFTVGCFRDPRWPDSSGIHVKVLDSVCVLARSGSKVANCVFDTYDFVLHFCTLTFFFRGVFTAPVLWTNSFFVGDIRVQLFNRRNFFIKILTARFPYAILCLDFERRIEFVRVFQSNLPTDRPSGAKAIRTAGSTADRQLWVALLIELKAQIL